MRTVTTHTYTTSTHFVLSGTKALIGKGWKNVTTPAATRSIVSTTACNGKKSI